MFDAVAEVLKRYVGHAQNGAVNEILEWNWVMGILERAGHNPNENSLEEYKEIWQQVKQFLVDSGLVVEDLAPEGENWKIKVQLQR